ncbi:MAG: CsgG/HfaB family protein [Thermosynechococcaceae cyanobacterium]
MPPHLTIHTALGVLLLTGLGNASSLQPVIAQQVPVGRQQVAVVDFSYGNTRSPYYTSYENIGVSKGVSAKIAAALKTDGTYRTVDQSRVEQTLKALNLSAPLTNADAIKVGKTLGADIVLTGTISKFEAGPKCSGSSSDCAAVTSQVVIETNVIETASGNVATRQSDASMTRSGSGVGQDAKTMVLNEVVDQAIANVVNSLTDNRDRVEFRRSITPWGTGF